METLENKHNYVKQSHTPLERAASVISGVFSPLMVPTYAYAMALWITTLAVTPERTRFLSSVVVFLITAALPMFTIIFLMRAGLVAEASIPDRKQRLIPYIVTLLCYLGAALYVWRLNAPHWLWAFFVGASAVVLAQTIINSFWKISAHMASMGGLMAFLCYIATHNIAMVRMIPWICVFLLISGAVGSSRLLLKRHTPAQVYTGFLLSFVIVYSLVIYL